jgi:hypothetical protein
MLFLIATSAVGFMISAAVSGSKLLGYSKDPHDSPPQLTPGIAVPVEL